MSVDRGFTWMDDETLALIVIFSKPDVQDELRGARRNIIVYEKVALELSSMGYSRTAYQCREKIKRLRKEYQHIKQCARNKTKPKKTMKYYDLVDGIFSGNSTQQNTADTNLLTSENDDEFHHSFNFDRESDASSSFTDNDCVAPQSILPGPSSLSELDSENSQMLLEVKLTSSPLITPTDSNNDIFLDDEHDFDLSEKDSPLDDLDSPWVPNIVLVENDPIKGHLESTSDDNYEDEGPTDYRTPLEKDDTVSKDSAEPPQKKRKQNILKHILDTVTESFLTYQETAESRFLERITHIERERMKRDEDMQKLWLEFEERRRKDEQKHELKTLSLLGQFVKQIHENTIVKDST